MALKQCLEHKKHYINLAHIITYLKRRWNKMVKVRCMLSTVPRMF